jgi:hypothetical protein
METTEQHLDTRRAFLLKGAAVGAGAIGAGRLLADPPAAHASGGLTPGDAAILQFLAAAEIIETDAWQQYNELGGIQDSEVTGGSGNPAYTDALSMLDSDMAQYIHDNTDDEFTHFTFINAYLKAHGVETVNLDKLRTLPSSTATGARQIGRLTNLMQLTVDTSWWTRYRSDSQNPDFGDTLPQAIPDLASGQHPAIPRSNADLTPPKHLQAIANTAGFHFAFIEQGGTSLYPSLAQRVTHTEVLRILLSIGPTETMLPDLAGQGRQRATADRPYDRTHLPRSERRRRATADQLDHARADDLPRPQVPGLLDYPADSHRGRGNGCTQCPHRQRALHWSIIRVLRRACRVGKGRRCSSARVMSGVQALREEVELEG